MRPCLFAAISEFLHFLFLFVEQPTHNLALLKIYTLYISALKQTICDDLIYNSCLKCCASPSILNFEVLQPTLCGQVPTETLLRTCTIVHAYKKVETHKFWLFVHCHVNPWMIFHPGVACTAEVFL